MMRNLSQTTKPRYCLQRRATVQRLDSVVGRASTTKSLQYLRSRVLRMGQTLEGMDTLDSFVNEKSNLCRRNMDSNFGYSRSVNGSFRSGQTDTFRFVSSPKLIGTVSSSSHHQSSRARAESKRFENAERFGGKTGAQWGVLGEFKIENPARSSIGHGLQTWQACYAFGMDHPLLVDSALGSDGGIPVDLSGQAAAVLVDAGPAAVEAEVVAVVNNKV
eukprot:Gb_06222 [translate_table: standard]